MKTMREKSEEVRQRRAKLELGGGPAAIETQHRVGKLTARERLDRLLDKGSFKEMELWAASRKTGFEEVDSRELPADAVIIGYGTIDGRPVCVYAQDFTVMGGTMGAVHAQKVIKIMNRAIRWRVPCIGLVDSGGVRLQDGVTRHLNDSYSGMFPVHIAASGVIPQISCTMGPCTAGAAYSPALTDFVFMVKGTSYQFISGPIAVKSVTFKEVTNEELGGALVHARISGCCDLLAENDEDCIKRCRELLSYLPLNNKEKPPFVDTGDDPERRDEELLDVVPVDNRKPYDMHKVIRLLVDNGRFFELKAEFARNMVTGLCRLGGFSVGVIANNPLFLGGSIDVDAADKEARFIRFCDAFNIPLLFLVDSPAYMPGVDQEHKGIIRHGAKVLYAISEATVPKITIYLRKMYGGASPAMCNEPSGCDVLLAWPILEQGVMDATAVVNIIYGKEIKAAANPAERFEQRLNEYKQKFADFPYHSGACRWVDDIIDPRDTRSLVIRALRMLQDKPIDARPWKKHGNMPV
ncbi:MAG: acyl-CoA carboxylase subunit beta [Chloroflexota bacterium]